MKKVTVILLSSIFSVVFCEGISGVSYFEYRNGDTNQFSSITDEPESHGFFMTRAYFTYQTNVSDKVSFKFQTDIHEPWGDGVESGSMMYIKNAKMDITCSFGTKVTVGLQGMNMFNVQEKTWGHHFVEKSAMDIEGWSSSADMGIGVSHSFGNFSTSFLYTNGEGYKELSEDNNMKVSVQAMYGEKRLDKNDGFNAGVVFSTHRTDEGNETEEDTDDDYLDSSVTGIFSGWAGMGARFGFEYNMKNAISSEAGMDDDKQTLMSFYANYKLMDNLSVMARYDSLEPNADIEKDETSAIIAGLVWEPAKGFTISPNMIQNTAFVLNDEMETKEETESEFVLNFQMKF